MLFSRPGSQSFARTPHYLESPSRNIVTGGSACHSFQTHFEFWRSTGTDFEPGVARHWAQFSVSEKSEGANSLKRDGEPGRTRTSNPLIKSQLLYHKATGQQVNFRILHATNNFVE